MSDVGSGPRGPRFWTEQPPPAGQALQVAAGVFWARMSMPFALDHVNVWMIDGRDGWTIVDTGMDVPGVAEAWQTLESNLFQGRKVSQLVLTHHHPDHAGMAGWLAARHGAEVITTRTEFLLLHQKFHDRGATVPEAYLQFYRAAGFDPCVMKTIESQFGELGRNVATPPGAYRRVVDGDLIDLGGSHWRVVTAGGHSPEQLCLYCPTKKVVVTADQVLPTITPNVSVQPEEPAADPLAESLAGSGRLRNAVEDDVLVLPAHERPFYGLHDRLQVLEDKQEAACARLLDALENERRVIDLLPLMYKVQMNDEHLTPAAGETLARLHLLMGRQQVVSRRDQSCVDWFRRIER